MSNDIVQRLRDAVPYGLEDYYVLRDAANEIDRLRAENEALRALYEHRRDLLRSFDTEVRRLRVALAAARTEGNDR